MISVQNKRQVFGAKTKPETKNKKKKEAGVQGGEDGGGLKKKGKKRDDLQLFWVLSRSMKLTSCHARLAATLRNVFPFTVETAWNSP